MKILLKKFLLLYVIGLLVFLPFYLLIGFNVINTLLWLGSGLNASWIPIFSNKAMNWLTKK